MLIQQSKFFFYDDYFSRNRGDRKHSAIGNADDGYIIFMLLSIDFEHEHKICFRLWSSIPSFTNQYLPEKVDVSNQRRFISRSPTDCVTSNRDEKLSDMKIIHVSGRGVICIGDLLNRLFQYFSIIKMKKRS